MLSAKKNYMKKRNLFSVLVFILSLILLSGCAGKLTADKKLIEQYTPPVALEKNEKLVYVIRQNTIVGAANVVNVALNDKIITKINVGEYCYFKVDDGINTLNLEQIVPFYYYRLENTPGNLYIYYTVGRASELPEDLGITAVMKSKKAQYFYEPANNVHYVSALMNPGILKLYLMEETDVAVYPDTENATITFIRPQSYAKNLAIGIWSENKFLGNLKGETYFQIKVPAGKYNFLGKSEHFSVLKAEVEAGKNYFIQVAASMGWAQAHIRLLPVTSDKEQSEIQKWLDNSKRVIIDETAIDTQIKKRLDLALPYIKKALSDVNEGKAESRYLSKGDGR